jgi:hypothetical protein
MKERPLSRQPRYTCSTALTGCLFPVGPTKTWAAELIHGKSRKKGRPAVIAGFSRLVRLGIVLLSGGSPVSRSPVTSISGVIRSHVVAAAWVRASISPGIVFSTGT